VSFLLDTNVLSEWVRPRPDPRVTAWLAAADEYRTYLSVVTLAELRHGIERLPAGSRRRHLDAWLRDELSARFEGRVLAIDAMVADAWGRLVAHRRRAGRPLSAMDAFIAATAVTHDLSLVTRNVADFEGTTISLVNPWAGA
jgi:toxin FitB